MGAVRQGAAAGKPSLYVIRQRATDRSSERSSQPLLGLHLGHARRHGKAQDIGPRTTIGIGDEPDILAHRSRNQHIGAYHPLDIANRRTRRIAGGSPRPNHAADPLTAEPHAHQNAGLRGITVFLVDEVVECLTKMQRLHIKHHLCNGIMLGGRVLRGRTFAPLARGQPVKRELLCVRCSHASTIRASANTGNYLPVYRRR